MQNRTPAPPAERPPVPDFAPVPRKYRHDGWTAARQRAFIAALAELGSVSRAARRINMSPEGAYHLRRQPGADGFRAAWEAALDFGVQRLTDIAIERATEGVAVPVFWRGEQVGEKRRYNDRLLIFLLRHHQPARYGALPPLGDAAAANAASRRTGAKRGKAAPPEATPDAAAQEEAAAHEQLLESLDQRLAAIRRGFKRGIAHDPAKRAAWELLIGPTDWGNLDAAPPVGNLCEYNMHRPDMILPFAQGTGKR